MRAKIFRKGYFAHHQSKNGMKKIVITFGLIGGVLVSVLMGFSMSLWQEELNFEMGEVMGYLSMIISLSSIFFGIKSYRDNHLAGAISFGRGFLVGLYITLVASAMYAVGWEIYYNTKASDFMEKYTAHTLEKAKADGATDAEIEKKRSEMASMTEWYKNPVIRFAWSIVEIFPVGLLITLLSAGLLRKREILPA
jgi:hypothetical protein